ncbi:patatin-like phospholipase family protein [Thiohalophilus thiocyanatoxydans]|uniref:NTE family protein n=1 Tax=Thiohalophilus thiocyanatoxydans TaxID=381308 RepID=A0A4R8IHM9_9GAMM|nr:patatin-like phospholipase family protein [Thiohalophilus thiocyanatoxydans]TDX99623.1 NTE family protein [Thiohalophilus thiocyanatoxydans]
MTDGEQELSLALGSGGARGLAQIGVIHWLEQNSDYRITSIAGASMGALIGGIYAAGKLELYEEWVTQLNRYDVVRLLDFAFSRSGLFSGERIMNKLEAMLGDVNIEDLPITFTAVATDIESGREVWLSEGSLFEAIRASIAIPTVFTPVKRRGRLLVDGGLLNPVPIAPTLRDSTDKTVAVTLSGRSEEKLEQKEPQSAPVADDQNRYQRAIGQFIEGLQDKLGMSDEPAPEIDIFNITSRSLEAMQNSIARFRIAAYNPDHLIEIPVNACGMFEFHRAQEMIDLGYERAEWALSDLRR